MDVIESLSPEGVSKFNLICIISEVMTVFPEKVRINKSLLVMMNGNPMRIYFSLYSYRYSWYPITR